MITRSIFSKLTDYTKSAFIFFLNIPNLLRNQFFEIKDDFKKLKHNLKNFAETNIKLGIYHLNNQNYNDAIFRFILVDKFLRPNDPFVNYWIGWTYFLKRNYKKAVIFLEKAKSEDKIGLLKFISDIDNVSKVPNKIYSIHRGMIAEDIVGKFFNKNHNLPRDLVIQLVGAIDKLPKTYSVLEIGSNVGLIGQEIQKRMQEGFFITGVESSTAMVTLQKQSGRDGAYDKIINSHIDDYLTDNKDQNYDIIISLDGFANDSDLTGLFHNFSTILYPQGYFAFALRLSNNRDFSKEYLEFSYNKNYVNELLKQCNFEVIADLCLDPAMKSNYFIFICKKLN